jgi:hypothetical protein
MSGSGERPSIFISGGTVAAASEQVFGYYSPMQFEVDSEVEQRLIEVLEGQADGGSAEELAQSIHEAYGEGARAWLDQAFTDHPGFLAERRAELAGFETRLIARWGGALDVLEFLIQTCQEIGREFDRGNRPSAVENQSSKFEAMSRLHAKGVLTGFEILTLLQSGYSTAAMARWRTLHEAAVTAYVLAPEDEEISRRYLAHRVVESYRAQADYERFWSRLNVEPPDWTLGEREATRRSLTEEFGREFMKPFGWAEPLFEHAPSFRDLEERAALDHLRPYYRMASHGIHPSGQGILWSIQSLGDHNGLMAGPSNAGLTDPAHSAAISLGQLTITVLAYEMDEIAQDDEADVVGQIGLGFGMQTVMELVDRVGDAFLEIHTEQATQQEGKERLIRRLVELAAARESIDVEAIARDHDVTPQEVHDCVEEAVKSGLITRTGPFEATVTGKLFLEDA